MRREADRFGGSPGGDRVTRHRSVRAYLDTGRPISNGSALYPSSVSQKGQALMELDYALLADVVSPRPDGKLDMHGVGWDTISAIAAPVTHPRMDLALRFLVSAQEVETQHRVTVDLITEDGAQLARMQADVQPMPEVQRVQIPAGRRVGIGIMLTLAGVTFPAFGTYSIVVTWDGNEVRERPLTLFVAPLVMPTA